MEKTLTREEIKQNRLKFAKGLQEPHREKTMGALEDSDNPNSRCCLGHGCEIFNINRFVNIKTYRTDICYGLEENEATAPLELITLLGLRNPRGGTSKDANENDTKVIYDRFASLTTLNDQSELTTQEIGVLIENWIEGGDNTPFIPLSEFME